MAETPLLDLDFVYNLADNDTKYIHEVVSLYIKNVSEGLSLLEQLIGGNGEHDEIKRKAHALKSSAGIVKVRDMYDNLVALEYAARDGRSREEMSSLLDNILNNFRAALPLLEAEREKTRQ